MKRAEANDPLALYNVGRKRYREGDYEGAFEYFTKAARLGGIQAHHNLSVMYGEGLGVEHDAKKKIYHLEEAAIGGHPIARYNLGCHEGRNGKNDRAAKHFIIAAKLGLDGALDKVKEGFQMGIVSKEEYAATLRGHQAAVDATKSIQRDAAYAFFKRKGLS
jgi:TPR repeat protein